MLVLANVTWDGLVADDYYRRGMQINRSLARDAEAARRELGASITFPEPGIVVVRLTGSGAMAPATGGGGLNLHFARAGRAGGDVHVPVARHGAEWRGLLPALPPGKWYVELGNEQWRLIAPVRMPAAAGELVLHSRTAPPPAHR